MKTVSDSSTLPLQIFKLIEPELRDVEERLKNEAFSGLHLVDDMNRYLHTSGGKRVRPTLLLLAAKLCKAPAEAALQLAAVVEMIHVATLVHDDIIDNSTIRRGRESLNAKWGNEVTVLFGDWLYMTAFSVALQERNFRVLDILIDVTRRMVEGELLQLERNHRLDLTVEEHLEVCSRKTAYLFSGCGRLAAVLGGESEQVEEPLGEYGRTLGMAFQLTDDLLDYTSAEAVLGKPVLKDLEEGNVTLPVIRLMEEASTEERSFLESVVAEKDFSPENKRRILALVDHYGTLEESRRLAADYARRAHEALSGLPASVYREALAELPHLVLNRSK